MPAKTRSVRRSEIRIVREITWKTSNSKGNNMETSLSWKRLEKRPHWTRGHRTQVGMDVSKMDGEAVVEDERTKLYSKGNNFF